MIYFLEGVGSGRVKIGWSGRTDGGRLMDHRKSALVPLRLLGVIDGDKGVESAIHKRFAEHRMKDVPSREVFAIEPIRADIAAILAGTSRAEARLNVCDACGRVKMVKRNRSKLCRRCANARATKTKQLALRPQRESCLTCGAVLGKSHMLNHGTGLCRPCAMRKAWTDPEYRARILAARALRERRRCLRCGLSEPKVSGKYHQPCWQEELEQRAHERGRV